MQYIFIVQYRTDEVEFMWQIHSATFDEEIAHKVSIALYEQNEDVIEAGYEKCKLLEEI